MDKNFKIILQLHAEDGFGGGEIGGGAGGFDSAESYTANDQTQNIDSQPETNTNQEQDFKPTVAIRTNVRTGRREIVTFPVENEDNSLQNTPNNIQYEQEQSAQPQYAVAQPEGNIQNHVIEGLNVQDMVSDTSTQPLFDLTPAAPAQAQPEYQSAAELLRDIQSGTVDESRIPMSMALQYATFKQQQQQQAVQQPPAQQQPSPDELRKDFFTRVENIAQAQALKDSGLTEEQLSVAEYSDDAEIIEKVKVYNTMVAYNRQNIIASVQRAQAQQQQMAESQRSLMNEVRNEINRISATEKNFGEIDKLMATLYTKMPYQDGVKYASAVQAYRNNNMTPQQAQDLKEYYEKARVQYYAGKHGLNVGYNRNAVPKLEGAGNGTLQQMANSSTGVTKEQLRNCTDYREKRNLIGRIVAQMDRRQQ